MTSLQLQVIGAGYVGLITAIGFASHGHHVRVVETRSARRTALARGEAPFYEPGIGDALDRAVTAGIIVVDAEPVAEPTGIALVCVGTPIGDDGSSDLSQLTSALEALRPHVAVGGRVAIRSTMPVGSTRGIIQNLGLPVGQVFLNPEFLRQGSALADFLAPTRIVIGAHPEEADPKALAQVTSLYHGFEAPRLTVSYEEAELIKNAANAFLALKLSFVNELAVLTEAAWR